MKAIVLSGEGAKGAFQAYALSKICKFMKPDYVVGVSSGAINSLGYSMLGANGLLDFWRGNGNIKDVFGFNWKFFFESGVYNTRPIARRLSRHFGETMKAPISFPVTNVSDGNMEWKNFKAGALFNKNISELIQSAITIPGLVRDDFGLVDGGVSVLCPIGKAIDLGATEIHVILGRSPFDVPNFKPWRTFPLASYAYRFLDLLMHNLMMQDIERCVKINREVKEHNSSKRDVPVTIYYPESQLPDALAFKQCKNMADGMWKIKSRRHG